jgi:hypothetical protein
MEEFFVSAQEDSRGKKGIKQQKYFIVFSGDSR